MATRPKLTAAQPPADKPIIQTTRALLALRDSGFSLSTALAEVVDNSIEAKAKEITIDMNEATGPGGRAYVDQIAIADDGTGMTHDELWDYLIIGHSSRWMSKTTIGKYGVGAKLAALNFAKCIDVWSRQGEKQPWLHVMMDLNAMMEAEKEGGTVVPAISKPDRQDPPKDLRHLVPDGTGTIVVWSDIDRLEAGRVRATFDELVVDVRKELSRIFREFLAGGLRLRVNKRRLKPNDPLYLMSNTMADELIAEEIKPAQGEKAKHFEPFKIADREPIPIREAGAFAYLTVTVAPPEVLRKRFRGGDELAKKLGLPEVQGHVSFVRLNREISFTVVPRLFPFGIKDSDRFIGIEVSFEPELDQYFGVRHVKRGVEPHGDLRSLIRQKLEIYVKTARKRIQEHWREQDRQDHANAGEHGNVVEAAGEVDKGFPKARAAALTEDETLALYRELASDLGFEGPDADRYIDRVSSSPYVIESIDIPGRTFVDIEHLGGSKIIVRLNKRHKFYKEIWSRLLALKEDEEASDEMREMAKRAVDGLTLMVLAYARAQAMESNPSQYDELTEYWGMFLETLLTKVTSA